jgi:hypothetical protein
MIETKDITVRLCREVLHRIKYQENAKSAFTAFTKLCRIL